MALVLMYIEKELVRNILVFFWGVVEGISYKRIARGGSGGSDEPPHTSEKVRKICVLYMHCACGR